MSQEENESSLSDGAALCVRPLLSEMRGRLHEQIRNHAMQARGRECRYSCHPSLPSVQVMELERQVVADRMGLRSTTALHVEARLKMAERNFNGSLARPSGQQRSRGRATFACVLPRTLSCLPGRRTRRRL